MTDYVNKIPTDLSKEVEIGNFKGLLLKNSFMKEKKDDVMQSNGNTKRRALKDSFGFPELNKLKNTYESKTEIAAFQGAMKLLFILGILIGLNPVRGVLETDIGKIRFSIRYWRFLHCVLVGMMQAIASVLCLYYLVVNSLTIEALWLLGFYTSSGLITFLFIAIGSKWSRFMKDISHCDLSGYIDSRIKTKCYIACLIFLIMAIIEHLLSVNVRIVHIIECYPDVNIYEKYLERQFPWFFYHDIGYIIPFGIILQVINTITTLTWSYSDMYIVCISIYLASILNKINKKIVSASEKYHLPSSYWRSLREDYNRATLLVRSFDDIFSGIILICFASNLLFICIQLFIILMHGAKSDLEQTCPNYGNGLFGVHAYSLYLLWSIIYILFKSLTVSLMAASVNTASLVPAPALYSVPSTAFCDEVSRFITQVNGDHIALSGFQFFYVTRDLVLSMAGIIVTYELVLLQFSGY